MVVTLPHLVVVALLSVLPISELRGAIFTGIAVYDMPFWLVYIVAVPSNLLIAPLVFFFMDYIHKHIKVFPLYVKLFDAFVARTRRRAHSNVPKYGYFVLTLFVAIPLPITGAYTGSFAALFFGMQRKKSIAAISLGVVIAGVIVTIASLMGDGVWTIFVSPLIK